MPQFGCSFFFVGERLGDQEQAEGHDYRIEAAADAAALSLGRHEGRGHLAVSGRRLVLRFDQGWTPPGCASVGNYTRGVTLALVQPAAWQRIGVGQDGAPFRIAPEPSAPIADRSEARRLVYVGEQRGCWLRADHAHPRASQPSTARLGGDKHVRAGWLHVSNLRPSVAVGPDCAARNGAAQAEPYALTVREVRIREHRSDSSSAPDVFVRVERRDPEVSAAIDRLLAQGKRLAKEKARVREEMEVLEAKDAASKVVPETPLGETQLARLASLQAEPGELCEVYTTSACGECSLFDERAPCPQCAKCRELEYLTQRKAASAVVPGAPLTDEETSHLEALTERNAELPTEISANRDRIRALRRRISARTGSVETTAKLIHYRDREIITVYPEDELTVSVWDEDFAFDDLYGRTRVLLDRATVEDAGVLRVGMPRVEYVELRFRPKAVGDD